METEKINYFYSSLHAEFVIVRDKRLDKGYI